MLHSFNCPATLRLKTPFLLPTPQPIPQQRTPNTLKVRKRERRRPSLAPWQSPRLPVSPLPTPESNNILSSIQQHRIPFPTSHGEAQGVRRKGRLERCRSCIVRARASLRNERRFHRNGSNASVTFTRAHARSLARSCIHSHTRACATSTLPPHSPLPPLPPFASSPPPFM